MKEDKKLMGSIFILQEKLIGREWAESRKVAYAVVNKISERQEQLPAVQTHEEAMEQAGRIRIERLKEKWGTLKHR